MSYAVEVVVMNKRSARDPEGETIHRHLVLRKGYGQVKGVRVGKYLLFRVDAGSPREALSIVRELVEKLRIYNPVVHDVEVRLRAEGSGPQVPGD
ncbi:MAG: phosphoribosylformylglycinamidine synthase, purS protein [Thermoprotei archaeon]|nr:MAG: phosphoribosylformylglycinamidine synthase, purS protein [Thermoprotei archaeon]